MARRADASNRPKRRRGVLRHYRRPVWRDRLFWLVAVMSGLTTAAFVAVILVITGVPDTPVGWLRPVLLGVIVLLLSFRLLGAGVTTSRHFQRGLGEGSAARPNDLEAKGRAAGAVVGRAVRAARAPAAKIAGPAPRAEPTPAPEATTPRAEPAAAPEPVAGSEVTDPQPEASPTAESAVDPPPVSAEPAAVVAAPDPVAPDAMAPDAVAPEPVAAEPEPETVPAAPAEPEPVATTVPAPSPKPKVTADAAARSIGSMVGRRMAERRKKG